MTNGEPRITVVTPSYNQAEFLEQCICSVLEQGYANLEYLVIDGGSRDNSVDIIRKHAHHITHWVSEADVGQSDAINKGFRRATGHVVAWLNSDDFYLPGALQAAAAAYRQNPAASFYFGNGLRVDRTGKPLGDFCPEAEVVFDRQALVWGLNYVLQPAAFIRREVLATAGYLDTRLKYGMDSDLWLKLSERAAPVPIQARLAASREYGATKTSTGSFERVEELRQIAEKHSGAAVTPGSLCYLLNTLHQEILRRQDIFAMPFALEVEILWMAVHRLLGKVGARPDGFPLTDKAPCDRGAGSETPIHDHAWPTEKEGMMSLLRAQSEREAQLRYEVCYLKDQLAQLQCRQALTLPASVKQMAKRILRQLGTAGKPS